MRKFPKPWYSIEDSQQKVRLNAELRNELARAHILFGKSWDILAIRDDKDDVLLQLDDKKLAQVHLTWTGQKDNPPFPITMIFDSLDSWQAAQEPYE